MPHPWSHQGQDQKQNTSPRLPAWSLHTPSGWWEGSRASRVPWAPYQPQQARRAGRGLPDAGWQPADASFPPPHPGNDFEVTGLYLTGKGRGCESCPQGTGRSLVSAAGPSSSQRAIMVWGLKPDWPCHWPAMWPGTCDLTSLCLRFSPPKWAE